MTNDRLPPSPVESQRQYQEYLALQAAEEIAEEALGIYPASSDNEAEDVPEGLSIDEQRKLVLDRSPLVKLAAIADKLHADGDVKGASIVLTQMLQYLYPRLSAQKIQHAAAEDAQVPQINISFVEMPGDGNEAPAANQEPLAPPVININFV